MRVSHMIQMEYGCVYEDKAAWFPQPSPVPLTVSLEEIFHHAWQKDFFWLPSRYLGLEGRLFNIILRDHGAGYTVFQHSALPRILSLSDICEVTSWLSAV